MAVLDFVQTDAITSWIQERIYTVSQARAIFSTKNVKGQAVLFPVASTGSAKAYTSGMSLVNTNVTSSNITIDLDQSVYDMQNIDTVDNAKSAQEIMPQVASAMGDVFARWIDGKAYTAVYTAGIASGMSSAALGVTTAPITVNTTALLETLILNVRTELVKQDIPLSESFLILPPELGTLAAKLTANSYRVSQAEAAWASGYITTAYGINIYESNNLEIPANGERSFIFGLKNAACIAIGFEVTQVGSSMPVKLGEYVMQVFNGGFGANNPALVGAGVVVETGAVA